MDPVQKIWLYENWVADQNDLAELAKNHAYLLGSFSNPEAVKQMMGEGNVHVSSDDEFEESTQIVRDMNLKLLQPSPNVTAPKKRKRRILQG